MRKSPFCDLGFDKCIYEPVLHILITGACLIMFSNDWGRTVSQTCWGVLQEDRMPLSQPLRWCCVDCVIHHEREVREEQHHRYIWREQAIKQWSWRGSSADINLRTIERNDQRTRRVIMACELYCCLLPQCEALRICRSGFPITTPPTAVHWTWETFSIKLDHKLGPGIFSASRKRRKLMAWSHTLDDTCRVSHVE